MLTLQILLLALFKSIDFHDILAYMKRCHYQSSESGTLKFDYVVDRDRVFLFTIWKMLTIASRCQKKEY